MDFKFIFICLALISLAGSTFGQLYESIERKAADLLISFSDKNISYLNDIEKLKSTLSGVVKAAEPGKYSASQNEYDSLINHLSEFESVLENISIDSAFVLFNQWYLHLSNTFYQHTKEKFFSSGKIKILLFSTSMSCYCTLKMSREQTVDIFKFIKAGNNAYDYWIIDSFEHNEVQIKYETFFAPSVIVFNGNNDLIYNIEYEEEMIVLLTDYFNNIH
jgi:hypothetical protein